MIVRSGERMASTIDHSTYGNAAPGLIAAGQSSSLMPRALAASARQVTGAPKKFSADESMAVPRNVVDIT